MRKNSSKESVVYSELSAEEQTSTSLTNTIQSTTMNWQPGQMKNCTEPGKCWFNFIFEILILFAIDKSNRGIS